ncbi:cupin domain-containing protein [Kitasatospora atroaurantiaca]
MAGLVAVALGVLPAAASATPGTGVSATVLAKGTSDGTIAVKGHGRTDVVVREVTIAPGGSTGWHYHPGQLIVVVKSGTITRTMSDCTVETTSAGGAFVEPAGKQNVHIGRNLGTEPVVLYVTYLVPEGSPLSVDAPDPGCP